MTITHDQHRHYLAIDFSADFETAENPLTMKQWSQIHGIVIEKLEATQPMTDESVWATLLELFGNLPDGKATKSFVYQTLVLNGITNITDGIKQQCYKHQKNMGKDCHIVQKYADRIPDHADRINGICFNLGQCIRWASCYPCASMVPTLPDVIRIDDSVLRK